MKGYATPTGSYPVRPLIFYKYLTHPGSYVVNHFPINIEPIPGPVSVFSENPDFGFKNSGFM